MKIDLPQRLILDTVDHREYIPDQVIEDIRKVWSDYGLGNDWYYFPAEYILEDDEGDSSYPHLHKFLTECFPTMSSNLFIHYWW